MTSVVEVEVVGVKGGVIVLCVDAKVFAAMIVL